MSVDREKLTELKEDFWKEPEPTKESLKESVEEGSPKEETKVEETATNEEAQKMVDSGEATIPEEAVVTEEVAEAEKPKVGDGEAGDGGGEGGE